MDLVVLAVKLASIVLVVYGGWLCLWHRAAEQASKERVPHSARNLRFIHEMGDVAANEPLKKAA
jgi:hypothetical protein